MTKTSPPAGKRKPQGYWGDPANVTAEAKALVEENGPEVLTVSWLTANGHSSLAIAIAKHGGLAWLRAELGLEQGRKPPGYWNPETVVAAAKMLIEQHGPGSLPDEWLTANGHGGLSRAIAKHGGLAWLRAELGLEQGRKLPGYWADPANAIAEARALVVKYGPQALSKTWLDASGPGSLSSAIVRHGGYAWARAELGLEQGKKPNGYWDDPANVIAEAKEIAEEHGPEALNQRWLCANGHGGLPDAITRHGGTAWLRAELGIEAPARSSFGDSVQHALDCTGNHTEVRDSDFYIYDLRNFTGFIKPGIAFDAADRAYKSKGQYGEELYLKTLDTRQEAYFLEQAILDATRGCAGFPEALVGWDGATEVRAMAFEDLEVIADRLLAELEELGVWEFAARFVPMTAAQRAICQQRALTGAPACAAAAV